MVEKKTTLFEAVSKKTLLRIIDTFYGLVTKRPDLATIFPNEGSFRDDSIHDIGNLTQCLQIAKTDRRVRIRE